MKLLLLALLAFISITLLADDKADFESFKIKAEQGNAEGQYYFALCYLLGRGVEKNNEKAVEWLSKSAAQGNEKAKTALTSNLLQDDNKTPESAGLEKVNSALNTFSYSVPKGWSRTDTDIKTVAGADVIESISFTNEDGAYFMVNTIDTYKLASKTNAIKDPRTNISYTKFSQKSMESALNGYVDGYIKAMNKKDVVVIDKRIKFINHSRCMFVEFSYDMDGNKVINEAYSFLHNGYTTNFVIGYLPEKRDECYSTLQKIINSIVYK
ncbi:MAG: tetratricopeptide repeat protein [Victivallales bacterium]